MSRERKFHELIEEQNREEKDAVWLHYGNFRAKVTLQPDGTALACEEDAVPDWMKLRPAAHGLDVMTSDLAMWLPFTRTK